jgi:hypothetical protein
MKTGLAVVALAVVALSSAVARAERPRVAVMEVSGTKLAPDLRERITRAVHEGLIASGADVVHGMPAAATGPGGAPCEGSGCVAEVAKATLAGYVVRGTMEVVGRTYELRLEMLEGKTGALLDSREDRCEICTEGEALEMAGVSASALKVQVFKKQAAATQAAAAPKVEAAVPAPAAAPQAIATSEPPAQASNHRAYGWIGVGVGVAAGVLGGYLIAIDGEGDCGGTVTCMNNYATKGYGIASLAGGALALAAGILVLSGTF